MTAGFILNTRSLSRALILHSISLNTNTLHTYSSDLFHLVQCQVNLVSANVRLSCLCQPHDRARDVMFLLGHVNGMELLIAELSHKNKLHFKASGQKSQQFGFSFKVWAHTALLSGEPSHSSWFGTGPKGERCMVSLFIP